MDHSRIWDLCDLHMNGIISTTLLRNSFSFKNYVMELLFKSTNTKLHDSFQQMYRFSFMNYAISSFTSLISVDVEVISTFHEHLCIAVNIFGISLYINVAISLE